MSKANEELSNDVKEAVRIMTDAAGHVLVLSAKVDDMTADTKDIKLALFGDNNGHKGVIRKLDRFEAFYNLVKWAAGIIGVLLITHAVGSWLETGRVKSLLEVTPAPDVIVVTATPMPLFREPTIAPQATHSPKQRYEVRDDEIDALGRLCTVEVKAMTGVRDDACLSVIDTVMTRIRKHLFTDGTIIGTIAYHCGPDTLECHFPAYSYFGCEGIIPTACPGNYPEDVAHFTGIAEQYFEGKRGTCSGHIYYGIKGFDRNGCIIQATNGLWQGWHD